MKLMIVDDSLSIRNRIGRENALEGISEIVTARNGREAVEIFRQVMPDVVTMDLTMPEMDGVECIRELLKLREDVIILVISAIADKATAIQAMHCGARGFLCKPFNQAQLQHSLETLIRKGLQDSKQLAKAGT